MSVIGLLARDHVAAKAFAARHGFVQIGSCLYRSKGLGWNNEYSGDMLIFVDVPPKLKNFTRGDELIEDETFKERPAREIEAFGARIRELGLQVRR